MNTVFAKLESLVYDCVQNGTMFTVYDLTQAVRQAGEFLKHNDSRDIVHGMFCANLLGNYMRTLVNLGGINGPCFVYHDPTDDPYRYQNRLGQTAQPAYSGRGRSGQGVSSAIIRQISRDPYHRPLTSRRRICIPASQVRGAGLNAGDTVYICFDAASDTFTYETQCPADGIYDRVWQSTVDLHGSIRHPIAQPQSSFYCVGRNPLGSLQAAPQAAQTP